MGPDFPEEVGHVWSAFLSLNLSRGSGDNSITYSSIKDWMMVTGNQLNPWEVDLVVKLDHIYRRVVNG